MAATRMYVLPLEAVYVREVVMSEFSIHIGSDVAETITRRLGNFETNKYDALLAIVI